MPKAELYKEALRIREIMKRFGARLIINDYVDIAKAVGADGVHLGQEDMPVTEARRVLGTGTLIGISTHTPDQAARAEREGADYIGFGPVFRTSTKDAGKAKGITLLKSITKHAGIPVVAIGGITCDNVHRVLDAGADACAIVSGIVRGDIQSNVKKFMHRMK